MTPLNSTFGKKNDIPGKPCKDRTGNFGGDNLGRLTHIEVLMLTKYHIYCHCSGKNRYI